MSNKLRNFINWVVVYFVFGGICLGFLALILITKAFIWALWARCFTFFYQLL